MRTPLPPGGDLPAARRATERARRVLDQIPGRATNGGRWRCGPRGLDGNHRAALELVESTEGERWKGVPTSLLACFRQRALHLDQAADESCGEAVRLLRDELEDQPRSLSPR
jgi:hypothetical protein